MNNLTIYYCQLNEMSRRTNPEVPNFYVCGRSETDIVNVVEQRIWHSMEEGHFENLPGKGKPLDLSTNPHADPAEDTLYRILSRNGCAPEWVELNKEIRSKIAEWRLAMKKAWTGSSDHDNSKWLEDSESLKSRMREINDKVNRSLIFFILNNFSCSSSPTCISMT